MTRVLENRCRPLFQKLLLVVPLNDDDKARDSQPRSLLVAQFTTFLHKILRSPIEVASTAQIDRSNYRTRDSSARMRLRAHTRFHPRTRSKKCRTRARLSRFLACTACGGSAASAITQRCIYVAHERTRDRCLYRSPFDRTVGLSSSLDTQQVREPAFASSFHRHSSLRASSCAHDCLLSLSSQRVAPTASPLLCFRPSSSILLALCLLFPPSVFSPSSLFLPPSNPIPTPLFLLSCIEHSISAR